MVKVCVLTAKPVLRTCTDSEAPICTELAFMLRDPPAPASRLKVEAPEKLTAFPAKPILMTPAPPVTFTSCAPAPELEISIVPPVRCRVTVPAAVAVMVPFTTRFCVSINTEFDETVCPLATDTVPEPFVLRFKELLAAMPCTAMLPLAAVVAMLTLGATRFCKALNTMLPPAFKVNELPALELLIFSAPALVKMTLPLALVFAVNVLTFVLTAPLPEPSVMLPPELVRTALAPEITPAV